MRDDGEHGVAEALIVAGTILVKHEDEEKASGEMECPICEKGTVKYSFCNYGKGIAAHCSTKGCVKFMS